MSLFGCREVEDKRDQLLEEEKARGTPAQERERLLQQVKDDNAEISTMERQISEAQEKARNPNYLMTQIMIVTNLCFRFATCKTSRPNWTKTWRRTRARGTKSTGNSGRERKPWTSSSGPSMRQRPATWKGRKENKAILFDLESLTFVSLGW